LTSGERPKTQLARGWCFVVVARRTLRACLVGEADKLLGELDDGVNPWVTPIRVAGRVLPRPDGRRMRWLAAVLWLLGP
jgi:hypothetical protein